MSVLLYPVTYTLKQLDHMPRDDLLQYLVLTHVANDVNRLLKAVIQSTNMYKADAEASVRVAAFSGMMMWMRLLAGRVYEAHAVLNSKQTRDLIVSLDCQFQRRDLEYSTYITKATETRKEFNKKRGSSQFLPFFRNQLAFHTDREALARAFDKFSSDTELTEYMAVDQGNTFYGGAELLIVNSMTNESTGDFSGQVEAIRADIQGVASQLSDFVSSISNAFISRYMYKHFRRVKEESFHLKQAVEIDKAELPFFMTVPKNMLRRAGICD